MDFTKFLEILDKNVDQAQLMKDLGKEFVMPLVESKLANLDLIPGTEIDNKVLTIVVDFLRKEFA